jgi:nicotinamidase-related amidase
MRAASGVGSQLVAGAPGKRPVSRYTDPEYHRSALIAIDVQCDTLDGGPFEVAGTSAILPRLGKLAETFRSRGAPIVHIVRIYEPDGSNFDLCRRDHVHRGASLVIAGSSGSQIAPPLLPSPPSQLDSELLLRGAIQEAGAKEWIIYKPRWGAFFKTPLESHLRGLGVSTLVFTGCNFPNCPRTSIYEASERDFRIVAVSDAISGLYDQGRTELENIGVTVVDTESYLRKIVAHQGPGDGRS